jgi:hypothetical protein
MKHNHSLFKIILIKQSVYDEANLVTQVEAMVGNRNRPLSFNVVK